MLLVLQRHQYALDRPFSYAYSQPWLVAGATTAILPSLVHNHPSEAFYKPMTRLPVFCFKTKRLLDHLCAS